jgi:hypothetical protein
MKPWTPWPWEMTIIVALPYSAYPAATICLEKKQPLNIFYECLLTTLVLTYLTPVTFNPCNIWFLCCIPCFKIWRDVQGWYRYVTGILSSGI